MEVLRDGSLQTLVFQIPPSVVRARHIADVLDYRTHVLLEVKRENPYSKIESFVELTCRPDDRCVLTSRILWLFGGREPDSPRLC